MTTALALDEHGGAPAWIEDPGSGFLYLWGSFRGIEADRYSQIRAAAEMGIGRSPT